jgi:filamentous hemagglutinin
MALLSGSAVTGKSFSTGAAFDAGRVSDFDIALASRTLLSKAREIGVQLRSAGARTAPLTAGQVQRLGLGPLQRTLSNMARRPVNFMIYGDAEFAAARAPSIEF